MSSNATQIPTSRLEELEFIELHYSTFISCCALEIIEQEKKETQKKEQKKNQSQNKEKGAS
jgi:hypothetical protein